MITKNAKAKTPFAHYRGLINRFGSKPKDVRFYHTLRNNHIQNRKTFLIEHDQAKKKSNNPATLAFKKTILLDYL